MSFGTAVSFNIRNSGSKCGKMETTDMTDTNEDNKEMINKLRQQFLKGFEDDMDQDLDSTDGFMKSLSKKISEIFGRKKVPTAESAPVTPTPQDFTESSGSGGASKKQWDDSDVYDFSHPKRGVAIIINNENFKSQSNFGDRPGSYYDAVSLCKSFTNLGFDILPFQDLDAWTMVEVLRIAAKDYDHLNADCFVCCILSHGDQTMSDKEYRRSGKDVRQDLLFGVDGKSVTTEAVISIFSDTNCPHLENKPRLFFFQACRGCNYDNPVTVDVVKPAFTPGIISRGGRDAVDKGDIKLDQTDAKQDYNRSGSYSSSVDPPEYHKYQTDSTDAKPAGGPEEAGEGDAKKMGGVASTLSSTDAQAESRSYVAEASRPVPVSPAPLYKDCLVMYATPPGYYAWRRKTGAWFIQSLCQMLDQSLTGMRSLTLGLTQVCRKVAFNYQSEIPSDPNMHQRKEMPVIESMLVKDVFLSKKRTG